MSMKEVLARLDRIERLLLSGAAPAAVPLGGSVRTTQPHDAERTWSVEGRSVAKLRADGGLELYVGPRSGLWTLIPGTDDPLTPQAIDALVREAMQHAETPYRTPR